MHRITSFFPLWGGWSSFNNWISKAVLQDLCSTGKNKQKKLIDVSKKTLCKFLLVDYHPILWLLISPRLYCLVLYFDIYLTISFFEVVGGV